MTLSSVWSLPTMTMVVTPWLTRLSARSFALRNMASRAVRPFRSKDAKRASSSDKTRSYFRSLKKSS
ncbi:hypothetical protein HZC53_04820 [Candidatus Uhrbacteria bacterium]|nr:hypothetical protein [Candidatus Uhrbacteria bacterium]